jgi:N-acetylmuramoyl-L-alanine amidase
MGLAKVERKTMHRVVFDPGHGGIDPGAVSGSAIEKDIALVITLAAADKLAARADFYVEVTRDRDLAKDRELSLEDRVAFSDRQKADLFVSVHCNAIAPGNAAHGFEIFHYYGSGAGNKAAQVIFNTIEKKIPEIASRSVKEAGFYVIKNTEAPAILIECGFLTAPQDRVQLEKAAFQKRYGEAIAAGVLQYFGEK